jgi:acetyl esterase/lipase
MPYKENIKEAAYGRDLDDRNDPKWSHPELLDWWVAGNADMIDMLCDDNVPLEKRKKRLEKLAVSTVDMYKNRGFDPFAGTDSKEAGSHYGHLETYQIKGCPEAPDDDCTVYAMITDEKSEKPLPVIFYVMGGAFFTHHPGLYNEILRWPKKFNCSIVIPDYSTPLDAQYPTQMNQLHAGYQWMLDNAEMLNIDPDNVVLFGESTGAHLALSLAFRLKRYGIIPRGCVVNDPMVDDRNFFESSKIIKNPCDATRAHVMFASYVGWENTGSNLLGPEAFANHATVDECKGLCPIFMNVGESDQDRDATIDFAKKLYEARVPCSLHIWAGAAHATLYYARKTGMALRFWNNLYGDLQNCMEYDMRRPWAWDIEKEAGL